MPRISVPIPFLHLQTHRTFFMKISLIRESFATLADRWIGRNAHNAHICFKSWQFS